MKKFYAIAAAAMMAVTVNAQNGAPLYATGQDFPLGSWNPGDPSEFVYANGEYTLEISQLSSFKLSTNKGSWDDFNSGVLTCSYGDTPGVAKNLGPVTLGDGNIIAPWLGEYTITVAGDLSTITLSTTTPKPAPAIYIRGDMNGWGSDDAWKLTEVRSNLFKFVFADGQSITTSQKFKIADASWGSVNYGGSSAIPSQSNSQIYYNGSDMSLSETCNGVIWVTLDFGGAAYLWYSNDKEAMPEWANENVKPTVSWGVIGAFNGWGGDEVMTETADGVFKVTMSEIEGEFKFRQNSAWAVNFGADGNAEIKLNGDYADTLSAVAEIEEDNAPVKYFNLQGVEVANPVNGLYIKVQGKKASKVLVK